MSNYVLYILVAFLIDLLVGDPYWLPHPVRFIGWLIKKTEGTLRGFAEKVPDSEPGRRAQRERRAGYVLTAVVVMTTSLVVWLIVRLAGIVHPVLYHAVNIYFIYSALAARCLANEAYKVFDVLRKKDLEEARKRLAMLVGRQTENLSEKEVIRGVVETTAENTVDGEISPLLFAFVGAALGIPAPLVYAFKAISTLDSMVGYMNEKYINIGRASAKLDDAANYLPARLSGLLIPAAALLCGKNMVRSFKIMLRDRRNHKSPNCAYPEAAVAGALGVRIGGTNVYFGQVVEKPTIGDADKELEASDITETIKIMYAASLLTLPVGLLIVAIIKLFV